MNMDQVSKSIGGHFIYTNTVASVGNVQIDVNAYVGEMGQYIDNYIRDMVWKLVLLFHMDR